MKKGIPTTLSRVRATLQNQDVQPVRLVGKGYEDETNYTVDLYPNTKYSDFILVTYKINDHLLDGKIIEPGSNFAIAAENSWAGFFVAEHNKETLEYRYEEDVFKPANQHFLSYCVAWALDLKIPPHYWIPDKRKHQTYLIRDYVPGNDPFQLKENEITAPLQEEFSAAIPKLVALSHSDLKSSGLKAGNAALNRGEIHYFDLNFCLDYSSFWPLERKDQGKEAIIMLEKMLQPNAHPTHESSTLDGVFHFENTDREALLTSFIETKEIFKTRLNQESTEAQFIKNHGQEIVPLVFDRLDACINYLKNKL